MIKVKHLMDAVEPDDGQRLWVEATGLARDLREWCKVDHVLSHLGPTKQASEQFEDHPDSYDEFRAKYHELLAASPYKVALQHLAKASNHENFTLLHVGEDPSQNAAAALHEFLNELGAWSTPQEG
jgi:uncharacterized protein YeaO (DUF488 family)